MTSLKKWFLFGLVCLFYFEQNMYFGQHFRPSSDIELIADGVNLVLLALWLQVWEDPDLVPTDEDIRRLTELRDKKKDSEP